MTRLRATLDSAAVAFLLYAAAAVGMTWPLVLDLTGSLPHGSGDVWQNLWTFWWWKRALLDVAQSPYFTGDLFFPQGASLALHTHSPFNQLLTLPVNALLGSVAAYNVATLTGMALSGLGAYLLARELVPPLTPMSRAAHAGGGRAAFLAGLVFAFFPHRLEQSLEHLNLSSVQFLPFVCLYAIRVGRGGSLRDGVWLGVFFALNAMSCLHYAIFLLFILPAVWLAEWLPGGASRSGMPSRGTVLAAAAVACVLLAPFVWPVVMEILSGAPFVKPPVDKGLDLAFLWLPSDHHPVLGSLTQAIYAGHRAYASAGFLGYLGLSVVGLSLLSREAVRRERQLATLWILGLVFLTFALGARPRFLGQELGVTFPHAFFGAIPVLQVLRVANRFVVVTMLALSVLAAAGLSRLEARGGWVAPATYALVLFEFLWLPFPVQKVSFPEGLDVLGRQTTGAVLDIPFCGGSNCQRNMAYQTVHGRPIAGGYASVTPRREPDPVLDGLAGLRPRPPVRIDVDHLRRLGFGAVVLHKDRVREELRARLDALPADASFYDRREFVPRQGMPRQVFDGISRRFEDALGPPIFEDRTLRIFAIR